MKLMVQVVCDVFLTLSIETFIYQLFEAFGLVVKFYVQLVCSLIRVV
jgi:hypothetical protein